jgi:hypothetical protein
MVVPDIAQAIQDDWYFQMYYDLLPIWGFIGTVKKILKPGTTEFQQYLYTHMHFDIHYNDDRVIEIVIAPQGEDNGVVDVSEGTMPAGQKMAVEFTYSATWHSTKLPFSKRLEHYDRHRRDPIHLEVRSTAAPVASLSKQAVACKYSLRK